MLRFFVWLNIFCVAFNLTLFAIKPNFLSLFVAVINGFAAIFVQYVRKEIEH